MATVNLSELYKQYENEDEVVTVPAGQYTLEVTRATVRKGQKGEGILPIFKVLDGPFAGKTMMAGQFTASENGRSIFFRQMKGFGLGKDFFDQLGAAADPMKAVAAALVGRVVKVQITTRQWQGQDRNNIQIGGITLVSAGQDQVAMAAGSQGNPVATTMTPAPAPAPVAAAPMPASTPVPEQVPQQLAQTSAVPPMPPLPMPGGSTPPF